MTVKSYMINDSEEYLFLDCNNSFSVTFTVLAQIQLDIDFGTGTRSMRGARGHH